MGVCIEFDPELAVRKYTESLEATLVKDMAFELGDDQLRTVAILIGLNASDFTYGWNGYINGLTLFYSHYTDTVPEEIHSLPITPGLTPIAFLQNIQKTYLGHPYTSCVKTETTNAYPDPGKEQPNVYKPNKESVLNQYVPVLLILCTFLDTKLTKTSNFDTFKVHSSRIDDENFALL